MTTTNAYPTSSAAIDTATTTAAAVTAEPTAERAPAVSVIMPAYNVAPYIGEAVASVFAQTFTDYEVVIVNDGSPDTPQLEQALEPYRERIIYIKQENRGPSGARNKAITQAQGEYVALLDADDMWLPDYLAEQMKLLQADPALDLVYTDAVLFGDPSVGEQTFMQLTPSRGLVTLESLLSEHCTVITSCVVARKQALIDAGLFDEKFLRSEDFDLWVRLAHRGGRLTYQQQVLARHRLHKTSLAANSTKLFEGQIEVMRKTMRTLDLSPDAQKLATTRIAICEAHINLERGKQQFVAGDYVLAAQTLQRANVFLRSHKLSIVLLLLRRAPGLLRRVYTFRHQVLHAKSYTNNA